MRATSGDSAGSNRDERLPPAGTTLVKRDRHGQVRCECHVEEGGFRYRGTLHRSLSGAASAAADHLGIKGRVKLCGSATSMCRCWRRAAQALRDLFEPGS